MKIRNILAGIGLLAFIASCTNTHKLVEYDKNSYTRTEITTKTNDEILENNEFKETVFNRTHRKVNKDMKGVWIATAWSIDFPKTRNEFSQKKEIDEIIKNVKNWGFNSIFFQVKPDAGVFFKSNRLPWSSYLTGKEDRTPSYDPLKYFIEEAHRNGLEFHAWINPYRVSLKDNLSGASERNIGVIHPEWLFRYKGQLYLDPSKIGVVEYLYRTIEEIVYNYDVDGIHLDDYFYPYPDKENRVKLSEFDKEAYNKEKYKYSNIGDFRRAKVNELIKNLSVSIHKIKPNISFGVAPFGIWRNISSDYRGSKTYGTESYDKLYADTLTWMQEKWIDYVAPQVYWKISRQEAPYKTLVEWWNQKAKETNTPLYIGEGVYKMDDKKTWNWPDNEVRLHSIIRRVNSNVNGYIIYGYQTLLKNPSLVNDIK
ncbi:glycoside hydrolase family 10 protein [Oceanivirga miroungae]|uniref:Glycosyl hydrolase-like 10 domain-containing protein n=1 Tax=Oceanivirga miroungae TaxID=1130046 RepID=A0A6I8M4I2_9FUSO|nr:family 10 glycosylhydrolase [Oceanivirga miroungae]VWL84814.1 hypothetical protein OMES3154_00067 [Oceanivirga miroungae]